MDSAAFPYLIGCLAAVALVLFVWTVRRFVAHSQRLMWREGQGPKPESPYYKED